jgi:DNA-binding GntR family transcriptional regulator
MSNSRTSPAPGALGRELLSDKVYALLREAILDGSQTPGSRVVESDLARQYGISQAPVREAIKRLVHEGLITSVARSGSYVTEVSAEESDIARRVRAIVEGQAAESVARQGDPEVLDRLGEMAESIVEAARRGDVAALRSRDVQFHRAVVDACGSVVLQRVWVVMEPDLVRQRAISDPAFKGDWVAVAEDHVRLADLLRADPVVAGRAFEQHANGEVEIVGTKVAHSER